MTIRNLRVKKAERTVLAQSNRYESINTRLKYVLDINQYLIINNCYII